MLVFEHSTCSVLDAEAGHNLFVDPTAIAALRFVMPSDRMSNSREHDSAANLSDNLLVYVGMSYSWVILVQILNVTVV